MDLDLGFRSRIGRGVEPDPFCRFRSNSWLNLNQRFKPGSNLSEGAGAAVAILISVVHVELSLPASGPLAGPSTQHWVRKLRYTSVFAKMCNTSTEGGEMKCGGLGYIQVGCGPVLRWREAVVRHACGDEGSVSGSVLRMSGV